MGGALLNAEVGKDGLEAMVEPVPDLFKHSNIQMRVRVRAGVEAPDHFIFHRGGHGGEVGGGPRHRAVTEHAHLLD